MKDEHPFYNPFRMLSPKLDHEALKIEKLHTEPLRESISLQEGLLIMVSKLMEICGLLSKAIVSGSHAQMNHVRSWQERFTSRKRFSRENSLSPM